MQAYTYKKRSCRNYCSVFEFDWLTEPVMCDVVSELICGGETRRLLVSVTPASTYTAGSRNYDIINICLHTQEETINEVVHAGE